MLLASSNPISAIAHPLFQGFAILLQYFYAAIPNYAIAIALLTLVVMVVVFPITRKGTRSMMRMQIYQPELKKIQQRYKAPSGATPAEKTELRQQLNEEMMAFYKENGISPLGGCLPMFLQLPIFWILYGTIRGLVHTTTVVRHGVKHVTATPLYIAKTSSLYHAIQAANTPADVARHGGIVLNSFGINLADSVRSPGTWLHRLPYIALILIAVGLQYVQMKQLNGRNPAAAAANPQMQQMQKFMPLIFLFIYIAIPAGVNVYFIVSSLFRIGQQEFMYRHDPQLKESLAALRERHAKNPTSKAPTPAPPRPRGLLGRLGLAPAQGLTDAGPAAGRPGGGGERPAAGRSAPRPPGGGKGARPAKAGPPSPAPAKRAATTKGGAARQQADGTGPAAATPPAGKGENRQAPRAGSSGASSGEGRGRQPGAPGKSPPARPVPGGEPSPGSNGKNGATRPGGQPRQQPNPQARRPPRRPR